MRTPAVELCDLSKFRRVLAVGDLHGDFASLSSIVEIANLSEDCIIFLGDYADRGDQGVEVIETLNNLVVSHPENVILLKGNHENFSEEGEPAFFPFTLGSEVQSKGYTWQNYFEGTLTPFFNKLYLAAIIPGNTLFVHGGISTKIADLNYLKSPSKIVEADVLWSDPFDGEGEHPNSARGVGVEFGEDVSAKVCERLGVERIVRSHEPRRAMNGPLYSHNGRVVTISSTRVYGGQPFILSFTRSNLSEGEVINLR